LRSNLKKVSLYDKRRTHTEPRGGGVRQRGEEPPELWRMFVRGRKKTAETDDAEGGLQFTRGKKKKQEQNKGKCTQKKKK